MHYLFSRALLLPTIEHGHVPDTKLEELGFPVDRDMDGTEVRRDATITQEARQRAKNLTHVHQVELRKERQEQIQAELTRKQADKQNKNSSQLAFNRKCEESLRALMSSEQTEISDSTLEHFFKCKKDELKGFIAARNGGTVPPSSLNKGTMQRATDGFDCLILRAFKCCSLPPMQEPEPPPGISEELTEEENTSEQEPQVANEHTIITASLTSRAFESRDLPSSLFSDLFITSVKKCFDSSDHMKVTLEEREIASSDTLTGLLCSRLATHVKTKVKDSKKHSHWSLKYVAANLGQVAAIMQLNSHIKPDLEFLEADKTLLGSENNFCLATNDESKQQGAYLYFDTNNRTYIRSGKVTGRSFAKRHSEHCKGAKLTTTDSQSSRFYSRYPSNEAELTTEGSRKGRFENLQQLVACGFDCELTDDIKKLLTTDVSSGGIFHWKDFIDNIDGVKFQGKPSLVDKQISMIGYMFELGYDLCLSLGDNVSSNPGLEACLGQW